MFENLLRRARLRTLTEGKVQTARAESLENDAKDDVERWQDYGFSGHAVEGQGLVLNVGGHTIVLRMDRLAERPQLAPFEVSVWHKEGHRVTLRAGKLVEVDCDTLRINAAVKVEINTPLMEMNCDTLLVNAAAKVEHNTPLIAMSAAATVGDTLEVTNRMTAGGVTAAGKVIDGHAHIPPALGVPTGPNL